MFDVYFLTRANRLCVYSFQFSNLLKLPQNTCKSFHRKSKTLRYHSSWLLHDHNLDTPAWRASSSPCLQEKSLRSIASCPMGFSEVGVLRSGTVSISARMVITKRKCYIVCSCLTCLRLPSEYLRNEYNRHLS